MECVPRRQDQRPYNDDDGRSLPSDLDSSNSDSDESSSDDNDDGEEDDDEDRLSKSQIWKLIFQGHWHLVNVNVNLELVKEYKQNYRRQQNPQPQQHSMDYSQFF